MTTDYLNHQPRQLVLATDLGARSDRALDRALQLAAQWQAKLTVVHAFERPQAVLDEPSWRQPQDPGMAVQAALEAELGTAITAAVNTRVVPGRPSEVVLKLSEELEAGLIVTGIKRDGAFERALLGDTVTELARKSVVPVLVVKKRARRPYAKIVVATDLSAVSRVALARALDLFGPEQLVVFHAAHAHFASRMDDRLAYESELRTDVLKNCAEFIAEVAGDRAKDIETVVEYGEPDMLLEKYVADTQVDLVVVATHGRSGLLSVLLGSVATRILDSVPCDVLVVRAT